MRSVIQSLLVVCAMAAPAVASDVLKPIAVGDWSKPTSKGLRGRLVLYQGRILIDGKTREAFLFVELDRELGWGGGPLEVYFDPANLKCELHDAKGKTIPPERITVPKRRQPTQCWVTLPEASRLRLRVSPCCVGGVGDYGLSVPLGDKAWQIKSGNTGDHHLSGTLTVSPPKDHNRANVWQGTLKLPKLKITAGKR